MLHPVPDDPEPDEEAAYASRGLSFALTRDSVIISGELPRLEGELVIAAIDAFAEKLRSAADHVPASARRADALVELVNAAHASKNGWAGAHASRRRLFTLAASCAGVSTARLWRASGENSPPNSAAMLAR